MESYDDKDAIMDAARVKKKIEAMNDCLSEIKSAILNVECELNDIPVLEQNFNWAGEQSPEEVNVNAIEKFLDLKRIILEGARNDIWSTFQGLKEEKEDGSIAPLLRNMAKQDTVMGNEL